MAMAALPTAATHTGEAGSAPTSARLTQVRPWTHARPVWNKSSSSVRRAAEAYSVLTRVPGKSRILLILSVGACSLRTGGAIFPGLFSAHYFELAAPVPACELRRVRALDLQP